MSDEYNVIVDVSTDPDVLLFYGASIYDVVDRWFDEHPDATTLVSDHSLGIEKLTNTAVDSLKNQMYYSNDYVVINDLIKLTAAETYELFDAYVDDGILTKSVVGYASAATPATGDAVNDVSRPIYMYSWTRKAKAMGSFRESAYNSPILLVSAIHGCEKLGVPALLTMLKDYKAGNPIVTRIFNEHDIDIIPVLNPFGYDQSVTTDLDNVEQNIGRVNARGVDLNRNGSTLWEATAGGSGTFNYKGVAAYSEAETKALRNVYSAKTYSLLIDLHTLRYSSDTNIFGVLYAPSSILRSIFSDTMEQLYDRIQSFGFNISRDTRNEGITGTVSPNPQYIVDYNEIRGSDMYAAMLEFPRYNTVGGVKMIYPAVIQKISADILVNFIKNAIDLVSAYQQNIAQTLKASRLMSALYGSIYPILPTDMVYGVVNEDGDFINSSMYRLVNKEPISVTGGTTYQMRIINLTGSPMQGMVYAYSSSDTTKHNTYNWSGDRTFAIGADYDKVRLSLRKGTSPDWEYLDKNAYGRDFFVLFYPVS